MSAGGCVACGASLPVGDSVRLQVSTEIARAGFRPVVCARCLTKIATPEVGPLVAKLMLYAHNLWLSAWDRLGGENPLCDCCGRRTLGEAGNKSETTRPYQIPELAQLGIAHVICAECAICNTWTKPALVVNLIRACVERHAASLRPDDGSVGQP